MEQEDYEAFIPKVQCATCGILIESNPLNQCPTCIQAQIDITEGLLREYILTYCPQCDRYLQPPKYWSKAPLESRELMTICLKKIKDLHKYTLVDASFLWTEPHSKQLKLKVVLQKELFANTVVQQNLQVDYVVHWQQCERCEKAATNQPQWDAVVQLRQKVEHKRTFLFLEQLILKHRMQENVSRIESHPHGLDFFFGHKSHAQSFVDFISSQAPVTRLDASQLVSHDTKSNTAVQHNTFSIEIAPLCREDLVVMPRGYYSKLGGLGPLCLVHKVYSSIVFLDPKTLRAGEVTGTYYWKNVFGTLASTPTLKDFYVLDVQLTGLINGKFHQAMAEVCLADEVGGDRTWIVPTHLGKILKPNDTVKGYLLSTMNFNNDDIDRYSSEQLLDVVIVRKHYPNQGKRRHLRRWRLRRLDIEESGVTKRDKHELRKDEQEFEDDLERDPEFRRDVQLFRAAISHGPKAPQPAPADVAAAGEAAAAAAAPQDEDDDDEAPPEVDLAELLDELAIDEPAETTSHPKRGRENGGADPDPRAEEDD